MLGLMNVATDEACKMAFQLQVSSHCARQLHHSASCHRCVDVCPTDALEIANGKVIQNTNVCTECGACAASCPMEAIHLKNNDINGLHTFINTSIRENSAAIIACNQVSQHIDNAKFVTCLAAADTSVLLQTITQGASSLQLICGNCRECPSRAVTTQIVLRVQTLKKILHDLKSSVQIHVTQRNALAGTLSKSVDDRTLSRAGVSRRALFTRLLKQPNKDEADRGSASKNDDIDKRAIAPSPKIPNHWQQLILSLKQLQHTDNNDVKLPLFYKLQISDQCVGCGICTKTCPTQALYCDAGVNLTRLRFTPVQCVGCGICQDVCFCNAVALTARNSLSLNESEQSQTLMEITLSEHGLDTHEDKLSKLLGCGYISRT